MLNIEKNRTTFSINSFLLLFLFSLVISSCSKPKNSNEFSADLIIYGGTSAVVTAAVEAVQSGKTVLVVSPDTHLGGLSSGGLGFTDTGDKSTIGGLSREFHPILIHKIIL